MTNFTLVGGGLGALVLAESLIEEGTAPGDIRIVDADRPDRASDNPGAIFHPFPGRSLEPVPRKMQFVEATLRRLDHWRETLDAPPIRETTMIRPLRDDHLRERLEESWAGASGYPDWFEGRRVDADTLAGLGAHLRGYDGGFVYGPAFSVDLGELTSLLADRLAAAGVRLDRARHIDRLERIEGGWRLACRSGGSTEARRVVLALGAALDAWFEPLAMRSRGGEMLHLRDLDADALDHIVNAGGHVAPHPRGGIVAGASWWDPGELSNRDDASAVDAILERCEPLYPPVTEADERVVWRGVRAIFGDHQPLVGPIPGHEDLRVFGAFGSKGLLRIPYHAEQFARQLLDKPADVPDLSKTTRMGEDNWRSADGRVHA